MKDLEEQKDCAFQYAYTSLVEGVVMKEDTGLITRSEAKELWKKYVPDFIERLKWEQKPQMAIWINMWHETDYREKLFYANHETKWEGNVLYNEVKEYMIP